MLSNSAHCHTKVLGQEITGELGLVLVLVQHGDHEGGQLCRCGLVTQLSYLLTCQTSMVSRRGRYWGGKGSLKFT